MSRIIIADDNRVSLLVMKNIVCFLGHEPVTCQNGFEALDEFGKEPADLVMLDVKMPVMNGIETCRKIRQLPKGGTVPIIIVSAMDEEEDIANGLNAGANDYLIKPVKDSHLLAKLKIFLRMSSLHNSDFELARNHLVFGGRYKIVKLLGYGSHSVVFLAEDIKDDKRSIALKLFKESAEVAEIYESFAETATKLKTIDSPHILKLRDFGQCDGRLFVAMDYADKGDLARIIKGHTLSQKDAALLGLHISIAIRAIANLGIVHFDIKPENIMIRGGNYMLADFGIVSTRPGLTIPVKKEIWGTIAYLPPEYFTEDALYPGKSDIYSLGITLYQCLTGENPFYSERSASSMFSQVNIVPPELASLSPEFDRDLSNLLALMLSKKPDRRPDIDTTVTFFDKLVISFENDLHRHKPVRIIRPAKLKLSSDDVASAGSGHEIAGLPGRLEDKPTISPERKDTPSPSAPTKSFIPSFRFPELDVLIPNFKTHMRYFAIFAGLILLGFGTVKLVAKIGAHKADVEDLRVLSVIKCTKCGHSLEKKIIDIENEKCPLCASPMGIAFECKNCDNIFAFQEKHGKTEETSPKSDYAPYKCPKCGSSDTAPVLTSEEYLKKKLR
jgi:serine/threonine protein kinase/ActR/RegA family two-component response regulator/Zn finger protein HypA/HybF involved in hydrogenase expression